MGEGLGGEQVFSGGERVVVKFNFEFQIIFYYQSAVRGDLTREIQLAIIHPGPSTLINTSTGAHGQPTLILSINLNIPFPENMKQMTRCKYHHLDIVSFCLNVGCLLPLCPQCISQHQAYHFQTQTEMCIVKLEQSIEAAQIQLSSMLLPLAKLRSEFHDIRCRKLEIFYDKIQKQKSILLARVEEEFNQMASHYIESIEQGLLATRDKLQTTIMDIQNNSIGLSSGSKTIETLVEFWINKRALTERVKTIQRDISSGAGMSGAESLNTTIMKNIELEAQRGISSTKQLFKNVPTAINQSNFEPILTNYNGEEIENQIEKDKVNNRISLLQEENKRILRQLGEKRYSR